MVGGAVLRVEEVMVANRMNIPAGPGILGTLPKYSCAMIVCAMGHEP